MSVLPPISRQTTAKLSSTTPRSTSRRLPPSSRSTAAFSPGYSEFDDPVGLMLQRRDLKSQISEVRRSLAPYESELRELEYYTDPSQRSPQIRNMRLALEALQSESRDLDAELASAKRTCQGSVHETNAIQNDELKQRFHEKSIVLERLERRLIARKKRLDAVLESEEREEIIRLQKEEKEKRNQLESLRKEGEDLYLQLMKKLSKVGSEQSNQEHGLAKYRKRLAEQEYQRDKKKKILREMRDNHKALVEDLDQKIETKINNSRFKEDRDRILQNRSERLRARRNNSNEFFDDVFYDEFAEEEDVLEDLSYLIPKKKPKNVSTIYDDDGEVPHFDYDLYGMPEIVKSLTYRTLFDEAFEPTTYKKQNQDKSGDNAEMQHSKQNPPKSPRPPQSNAPPKSPRNKQFSKTTGNVNIKQRRQNPKAQTMKKDYNPKTGQKQCEPAPLPEKGKLSMVIHEDDNHPHFDYDMFGMPQKSSRRTFHNLFEEAFC